MLCHVCQGDVRRPVPDHQVDHDQALEDDGPYGGGISQPGLQRPEDLADPRLSRVRRGQEMADVFLFGRGGLLQQRSAVASAPPTRGAAYLDLGGALDRLLEGARHLGRWSAAEAAAGSSEMRLSTAGRGRPESLRP